MQRGYLKYTGQFLALLCFTFPIAQADQPGRDVSTVGRELYTKYCEKCHGEKLDGHGKMARIYISKGARAPANLSVGYYADRPDSYLNSVIKEGGKPHGMSLYMPPFGDELSDQQVKDVIQYIRRTAEATRARATSPAP